MVFTHLRLDATNSDQKRKCNTWLKRASGQPWGSSCVGCILISSDGSPKKWNGQEFHLIFGLNMLQAIQINKKPYVLVFLYSISFFQISWRPNRSWALVSYSAINYQTVCSLVASLGLFDRVISGMSFWACVYLESVEPYFNIKCINKRCCSV